MRILFVYIVVLVALNSVTGDECK